MAVTRPADQIPALHVMVKTYCGQCRRAGSKHARNRWRSPPHTDGGPHVGRRWWLFTIRLGSRNGPIVAYHQSYASYERVTRAARRAYTSLADQIPVLPTVEDR